MKTYLVTVEETILQTSVYTVLANSEQEAREKAAAGETESEDIDAYSREIAKRQIRSLSEDDLTE